MRRVTWTPAVMLGEYGLQYTGEEREREREREEGGGGGGGDIMLPCQKEENVFSMRLVVDPNIIHTCLIW